MQQRSGIVLRRYFPKKQVIAVLDSQLGVVDYIPDTQDIALGALLSYWVVQKKGSSFMYGIENLKVPLLLAKNDILFFHHILEICYYFVPRGGESEQLFMLMYYLYNHEHIYMNSVIKKCFLARLFSVLGIYPYRQNRHTAYLLQVISGSIDLLANQNLDLEIERELDAWLKVCLSHHPALEKFKTMHFLQESITI